MFGMDVIRDWRKQIQWRSIEQVEQDLIISIALVKIFNNQILQTRLAFRGGTALNKLVFPEPLRYSEDIDMNRLDNSPVGPLLDAIKDSLSDLFVKLRPKVKRTDQSVKIIYKYPSIAGGERNLKIEINVRETLPQKDLEMHSFIVDSMVFQGKAEIVTFNNEEMIGTKMRALYQRRKGRDLFDLYMLRKTDVDWNLIIESFNKLGLSVSKEDFEKNLEEKIKNRIFLDDITPLLPHDFSYDIKEAYQWFKQNIITKL